MNGATAELWRDFMDDTGGNSQRPLPNWLLESPNGAGNKSSNQGGESTDTNSGKTEATPVKWY